MSKQQDKIQRRLRRKFRIRKKVKGTLERPRLGVFRSLNHLYCQLIDDDNGQTLISGSTNSPQYKEMDGSSESSKGNCASSAILGRMIALKAKEKGITRIVFDRAGYKYHGRVKALADSLRKEGLKL